MEKFERAYAALHETALSKGFFNRALLPPLTHTAVSLAMIAGGLYLLWLLEHTAFRMGATLLFSMGFVQASLVGHDIAHRQVFRSRRAYDAFGTLYWNFLLGVSFRYWVSKHDRHHAHPNQIGKDPDLGAPFIFSETQAARATALRRWFAPYQKLYFFFILALAYVSVAGFSVRFLARQPFTAAIATEWFLYVLHFAAYFALLGSFLPLGQIAVLTLVHYLAMGVYLGMIFAPNHKGLRMFDQDDAPGYVYQQVVTSRNIRPHPITDFFYGGLNYQIEHHLFPTMPRAYLKRVSRYVRSFCGREGIPYRETSFLGAFRDIYTHFVLDSAGAIPGEPPKL